METKIDVQELKERADGPGRFEGEGPETVYFDDLSGEGEILQVQEDGCGVYSELFEVNDAERAAFGQDADQAYFLLEQDGQGFVTGEFLTASEAAQVRAKAEEAAQ